EVVKGGLLGQAVDVEVPQGDPLLQSLMGDGPARLAQEVIPDVDAGDRGAATGGLHRVEAGVAADVEGRPTGEIRGQMRGDPVPEVGGEVAERVGGRGP